MKIIIRSDFNKRKWVHRLFPFMSCKHKTVSVEEGFESRYGMHTSYIYCLNCGREAIDIENHCNHSLDCFGVCKYCLQRQDKFDCKHKDLCNEPDTDEWYCENCGEWIGK